MQLRWTGFRLAEPLRAGALILATLVISTLAVALLRAAAHVSYPAPVYLLAVVAAGLRYGTLPAIVASLSAFVLYDFLFTEPYYTLTIKSPDEWLNLLVLLAVAVVIGRLAALEADRATEASERAREAEALHAVTNILAATRTVDEAAPVVVANLLLMSAMNRVWVGLGPGPSEEKVLADTGAADPLPVPAWYVVLQRGPGGQMRWVRVHLVAPGPRRQPGATLHRVRVEVAGETLGSVWALRSPDSREPDRAETRIFSAAADQLGQAVVRDRLAEEATTAEVARQSEALKTALLDSVSHDLRTPLATIRAAAGSMLDRKVRWTEQERLEAFEAIDSEAERMGRLVRNLLDLSRIEAGALKPELEAHDLADLVRRAVERTATAGKRVVAVAPDDLPPVLVDEVYLSQVLANLLENAVRYGGDRIEVRVRPAEGGRRLLLSVEDDGEGVPDRSLPRLFEKFFQVPRGARTPRRGMGIGLAVVAGLAGAMGGQVRAGRSDLGGLSVAVDLPTVEVPDEAEAAGQNAGDVDTLAARPSPPAAVEGPR